MKKIIIALTLTGMISLNGCATIVKSGPVPVAINHSSVRSPVHYRIKNEHGVVVRDWTIVSESALVSLSRKNNYLIEFKSKDGSIKTAQISKKLRVGSFIFGNFFGPGVVGYIVDAVTGNMWTLIPKQVNVSDVMGDVKIDSK